MKALLRDTLTIVRMLVAVMAGSLPDPTVRGVVESLMRRSGSSAGEKIIHSKI